MLTLWTYSKCNINFFLAIFIDIGVTLGSEQGYKSAALRGIISRWRRVFPVRPEVDYIILYNLLQTSEQGIKSVHYETYFQTFFHLKNCSILLFPNM